MESQAHRSGEMVVSARLPRDVGKLTAAMWKAGRLLVPEALRNPWAPSVVSPKLYRPHSLRLSGGGRTRPGSLALGLSFTFEMDDELRQPYVAEYAGTLYEIGPWGLDAGGEVWMGRRFEVTEVTGWPTLLFNRSAIIATPDAEMNLTGYGMTPRRSDPAAIRTLQRMEGSGTREDFNWFVEILGAMVSRLALEKGGRADGGRGSHS